MPQGKGSFSEYTKDAKEPEICLPPDTVASLEDDGCSRGQIAAISREMGGSGEDTLFTPEKDDTEFNKVCDETLKYLDDDEDDKKWGNLVDPARKELLKKNYQAAKDRKLVFQYKYGIFIENMRDFAYRQLSVRDLGLRIFPTWRYASGARDSDLSGMGRLGIMGLGDILVARQNNLVSDGEFNELKGLCPQVYSTSSACSDITLTRFKTLTGEILARIPNGSYTKNMMQYHEENDLHTLSLVPAGLHSTIPEQSGWRKLPHKGGQAIAKKRDEVRGGPGKS
jgi:hypothetical protein